MHDALKSLLRLAGVVTHDHAFAGGQPACLHHETRFSEWRRTNESHCIILPGEHAKIGRGNGMPAHELLGECLGTFQLRGCLRRAKGALPLRRQLINNAFRQGGLGADHDQFTMLNFEF